MLQQKNKLINRIDEAISREDTSPKNAELLKDVKEELLKAKTEAEYFDAIVKVIEVIGALATFLSNSG